MKGRAGVRTVGCSEIFESGVVMGMLVVFWLYFVSDLNVVTRKLSGLHNQNDDSCAFE
jgi:hypothetical protein